MNKVIVFLLLFCSASFAEVMYDTTGIGNQGGLSWSTGVSQRFTTSSQDAKLNSVSIGIFNNNFPASIDPVVRILGSDTSGSNIAPDYNNVLATLTSESGSTINMNAFNTTLFFDFTADTPVSLDSNTTYWVQVYGTNQVGTTSISYNYFDTHGTGPWYSPETYYTFSRGSGPNNQLLNGGVPLQFPEKIMMSIDATAVPEPASMALMGLGLGGLALARRKRKN